MENFLIVSKLLKNDGQPETPFRKKRKDKHPTFSADQPDSTEHIPCNTTDTQSSKRQKHHDTYHNQPDHPANLDLATNTILLAGPINA